MLFYQKDILSNIPIVTRYDMFCLKYDNDNDLLSLNIKN